MQEIANNHNATLFIYGEKQLPRRDLMVAVRYCQDNIDELRERINAKKKATSSEQDHNLWATIARAETLLSLRSDVTSKAHCSSVLDLARQANTTDPRDKVYGFLGLLENKITSRLTPDYDSTVLDVYTEFAIALVDSHQNLTSIFAWCNSELENNWPS